jgi:hypothetical protein
MHPATEADRPSPGGIQTGSPTPVHRDTLVAELERRILELDDHDEPDFGGFNAVDWLILLLGAVVVPILFVILFAP